MSAIPTTADLASLIARLDLIESRQAIEKLVANTCHGVDKREEATFLSVWHEDGIWVRPQGNFQGKAELARALKEFVWSSWQSTQHWASNLVTEINQDSATGLFDMSMQGVAGDGKSAFMCATYTDRYARRDGRWGVVHRQFKLKYFSTAAGINFAPPA